MSRRSSRRDGTDPSTRLAYKAASVLLCYPGEPVYAQLDDIAAAVGTLPDPAVREPLARTAAWLAGTPRDAVERHHVEAFDFTRRACPYLTYYRYGDTRQRGMALLSLRHTYRRGGFEHAGAELPDYLPVVLEFAALAGEPGQGLLTTYRAGLELLRMALRDMDSPYADVPDAVAATLPALSARESADVRRLVTEGPPTEQVGVDPIGQEPFAPPELLSGGLVAGGAGGPW